MDRGPLVNEEIEAGAELAREFDKEFPLKAAFWLKADEEDFRYLYLASDQIDDTNFTVAYRTVLNLTRQLQSPYLNPFRVKVIGGDKPLAIAALEAQRRQPGRFAIRTGGTLFGGSIVEDVYIYPSPVPVAVS